MTLNSLAPAPDWWKRFFTPANFPLDGIVNEAQTRREALDLARLLPVRPGAAVLDVGCGTGRHSVPLARLGYEVTGVDYSRGYLAQAARRAARARVRVEYLRRDMRSLGFEGRFDAVVNLWTSFGYFPRFTDDIKALVSMRRALKPGGWLILDIVNAGLFADGVAPRHWTRSGDYWALEESELRGGADPAMLAKRIYIGPRARATGGWTFVRLYTPSRLKAALERAGFSSLRMTSGLLERGVPLSRSKRLLALARQGETR